MAEYASQTVAQLKVLLTERGLATDGKKADLVQRLSENDAHTEETPSEPVSEPAVSAPAPVANEEPAKAVEAVSETVEEPEKKEEKPQPKVLSPEERKQLAVDLLTKKLKRAEKFGDEAGAEAARKDLKRVDKFGVELGTALAREIGLVDKSLSNGLSEKKGFKKGGKKNRRQ